MARIGLLDLNNRSLRMAKRLWTIPRLFVEAMTNSFPGLEHRLMATYGELNAKSNSGGRLQRICFGKIKYLTVTDEPTLAGLGAMASTALRRRPQQRDWVINT